MRVVSFENSNHRVIVYPAEGQSAFRSTRRIGDYIVGQYFGTANEATLPTYTGGQYSIGVVTA